MKPVKITTVGNSAGIVLTAEMLAKLGVKKGDELYPVETPNGVEFRRYDAEFAKQMEAAEYIMQRDRELLNELAKR